ncbi:unnamed protein product [Urochloa decumbens]|uniref:Ubiquitin-like protease family profile domain-containing protein n=1 Tax=Urochloa decumbens TaxID=240449 RepID=A0ABC9DN39_9POAL
MRKLNPDTMTLELDGDQRISITQHTIWCVFQLPRDGGGPPEMTDAQARLRRRQLAREITGEESDKISPPEIEKLFTSRTLSGDIGLRAFFMCAFQSLLFSNSSCYIRLDDVKYTEDMQNIGQMNWCKVVVDNLSKAARLYKVDYESKGMAAPISGCGIFLVMLYIDFLQRGYDLNPFALPRCAHLETNMIDRISSADRRGDVAPGVVLNFGHLRLKNINDTCYRLPHPSLPVGAGPIAPAVRIQSYPGPSTSAGTSQHVPAASHDPIGQAGFNLQPPGPVKYPRLSAVFSQGIIDVVGRSRKSQAMNILEDFDASALEAQSLEAEAVSFMNRASVLMAKAHHECFTGIQKLIEDAKAEKKAANAARRGRQRNAAAGIGMPPATDQAAGVEQPAEAEQNVQQSVQEPSEVPGHIAEEVVQEPAEVPVDGRGTDQQVELLDAQPLETRRGDTGLDGGDDFVQGLFNSPGSDGFDGEDDGRNSVDQGNDDFMDTVISTPSPLRGPSSVVDSIISKMYDSKFVDQEPQQQENSERHIVLHSTDHFLFDIQDSAHPNAEDTGVHSADADMTDVHENVNQQDSAHPNPEAASSHGDGDCMQRRPEATDTAKDMGVHSADVARTSMTDVVHTQPSSPGKECGSDATNAAKTSEVEVGKDDTTDKYDVDKTSGGAGNKGAGANTSGGAGNKGVGDALKKVDVAQEHQEHGNVIIHQEHVPKQPVEKPQPATYSRRITRATRAAEASKRKSVEADKAKQLDAATVKDDKRLQVERKKEEKRVEAERKKEEKRHEAERKKAEKRLIAARKKAEKKEQERLEAEREHAFLLESGLFMDRNEREKRDEHERRMQMLREDAEQEIDLLKTTVDVLAGPSAPAPEQVFPEDSHDDIYSQSPPVRLSQEERILGSGCHNQFQRFIYRQVGERLRRKPRKFISPFKIATSRPKVPKERALAMRTRIANDQNLQEMTLLDFSIFLSYTGKELLTTFADNQSGENNLLDYIVHCLRYDDIVHKQDSIGYRVFLPTGLWTAAKDVEQEYMDDGKTETEEFKSMREHLEVLTEHYDLTKAKLIFMPACDGSHYFLYCINLIHNRIDILDSIDYWWNQADPDGRHLPVWKKLPLINQAIKKLTKGKFPTFHNWSKPFIDVPKQAGPSDCMFFVWKYMEFWDGDRLNIEINPFKGMIYRIEMMHYAVFHALNQADLPDELDIFRLGGRKIEFDQSQ